MLFVGGRSLRNIKDEEKYRLIGDFHEGKSVEEIALELNTTVKNTIAILASMADLEEREQVFTTEHDKYGSKNQIISEFRKGSSIDEIADICGISAEEIEKKLKEIFE